MTQREAAVAAVNKVGLNQIREVDKSWFDTQEEKYEMFVKRLEILRKA